MGKSGLSCTVNRKHPICCKRSLNVVLTLLYLCFLPLFQPLLWQLCWLSLITLQGRVMKLLAKPKQVLSYVYWSAWQKRGGEVAAAARNDTNMKEIGSILKPFGRRSPDWCLLPVSIHLNTRKKLMVPIAKVISAALDLLQSSSYPNLPHGTNPITKNPGHHSQQL